VLAPTEFEDENADDEEDDEEGAMPNGFRSHGSVS